MDMSVSRYVSQLETDREQSTSTTFPEETTISEIHSTLSTFVTSNPEAWAPIISTWSLELLGELSSRYAGRGMVSISAGLGESLQLWMSCRATRSLMDLTTQCLSCLMSADTEACINALLDVSVKHSPHFDWVVAHVGSCFPRTVVTRVLSCGLKDFYQQGILGHLASSHFGDIKTALVDIFKWSLEGEGESVGENSLRLATVPYLLHLASLSPTLLKALSADTLHSREYKSRWCLAPTWCEFFGTGSSLQALAVHLALGFESGGAHAFTLLLDAAGDKGGLSPHEREACRETLEVGLMLRTIDPTQVVVPIPLLICIQKELASLHPHLLSSDGLRAHATVRLISLMGQHSAMVPLSATSFLLANATEDYHLGAIIALCQATSATQPDLLADALEQELRCPEGRDHSTLWKNLTTLLRNESCSKPGPIVAAARRCFPAIADAIRCGNSDAAEVLELSLPGPHSVETSLKLTHATITYFFLSLETLDDIQRRVGTRRSVRLLAKLCADSLPARSLALRELLDSALHRSQSRLFGAATTKSLLPVSMIQAQPGLLKDNQKQGVSALLPQRHSTVFHAGIIGQGPRKMLSQSIPPPAQVSSNCQMLVEAVRASCSAGGDLSKPLVPEAVADMALTLVELISPDVMYNGLPWPEEDFAKVTVERDLHIRRILDDRPLTWDLLRFAATQRPALCYCSVVLRAYAASLIGQWGCAPSTRPLRLTAQTQQLLDLLSLGQLLPASLASSRHLLPDISPSQVVLLLRDVWNYLKDNVPAPALFVRDPNTGVAWRDNLPQLAQYTECLRLTMQTRLETLGGLYAQVFVKPQLGDDMSERQLK
ncbi:hypothetical protein B566_EDAN005613 [Ephemera danica]|nr:hypothetical protein B566_EDAN005613 [Ephemera danica]